MIDYRDSHTLEGVYGLGLLAIGGSNGFEAIDACEIYDVESDQWQSTSPLPYPLMDHTSHIDNFNEPLTTSPDLYSDVVYVIGGRNDSVTYSSILGFDVSSQSWLEIIQMNHPRYNHASIITPDDFIIISGGRNTSGAINSVEKFIPQTNEIVSLAPMNEARFGHSVSIMADNSIIVAGGIGVDGTSLNSVEIYNPTLNVWNVVSTLNESRAFHSSISVVPVDCDAGEDGTCGVFVHGGITVDSLNNSLTISSAEYFCPCNDEWTILELPYSSAYHELFFNPDPYWNYEIYSTGGIEINSLDTIQSPAHSIYGIYLSMDDTLYFEEEFNFLSYDYNNEAHGRYKPAITQYYGDVYCTGGDYDQIGTCWKTNDLLNVQEIELSLKVSPNPIRNNGKISYKGEVVKWELFSLEGEVIAIGTNATLDFKDLSPGVYILIVNNRNKIKLIKM